MMQGGSMALRVAATQQLHSDSQGDHSSSYLTQQHNNSFGQGANSSSSGVPMDLSSGGCLGGLSGKLSYIRFVSIVCAL